MLVNIEKINESKDVIQGKIKRVRICLITYMSLWDVNIQQKMFKGHSVYRSEGTLLAEEHLLLKNYLENIIDNKGIHYADAQHCMNLFDTCENKLVYQHLVKLIYGK